MTRRERRERLERLVLRPSPWTDEMWREWAEVSASDILDRGGAFAIGHAPGKGRSSVLVVGPFGDPLSREIGSRAAYEMKEI